MDEPTGPETPSGETDEAPGASASAWGPLLWILIPLLAVIVWQLFAAH